MTEVFTLDRQIEWMHHPNVYVMPDDLRDAILASLRRLRELERWKVEPLLDVFERSSLGLLVCVSATLSDEEMVATADRMFLPDKYRIRASDVELINRTACLHHQGRFHIVLEVDGQVMEEPKL